MWVRYGIFILLLTSSYKALSVFETNMHYQVVVHWSYLRDWDEQSFQEPWLTLTDHESSKCIHFQWRIQDFPVAKYIITARKQSLGQSNIFTPVLQSFWSQGGGRVPGQVPPESGTPHWDQVHPRSIRYTPWDQVHPWDQVQPPGPGTPPWDQVHPLDQVHPHEQCMLGDTGNKREVRILLKNNNPEGGVFLGPPGSTNDFYKVILPFHKSAAHTKRIFGVGIWRRQN